MSKSKSSSTGFGLLTTLFLIFLVLKLTGYIDWSWWYITMPLWGGWALLLSIAAIVATIAYFAGSGPSIDIPNPRPKPKSRFQARLDQMAAERNADNNEETLS